ncbi:hypothetical protein ABID56_002559 [Alkalibacillus flavidus]|uniref:Uncharacterized protein n=1 Tax=Alkalibacillus flavidus TaxID=546021 RepID=A0ABV2KZ61_9BACI
MGGLIEGVWERIVKNEGEVFKQKRGKEFSYSVKMNTLYLRTTNRIISKKTFEKALDEVPLENTVPLQNLQAPSYLYAILMDNRIRKDDY